MDENADGILVDPPDQVRAFVSHGRITAIPAKRTRRRLLLDQVVQAFEPGRRYPEAAVDELAPSASPRQLAPSAGTSGSDPPSVSAKSPENQAWIL